MQLNAKTGPLCLRWLNITWWPSLTHSIADAFHAKCRLSGLSEVKNNIKVVIEIFFGFTIPSKYKPVQKNHIRFKIYPFFTIFDIMWSIICFTKRNVLVSKKKSLRSKEIIGEGIIEYHKKRIEIIFKNKTKKWNLRTISIQSTCCWLKATMKSYTDSIHVASISMYKWKKRHQIDENKDLKPHFDRLLALTNSSKVLIYLTLLSFPLY